MLKKMMIAICLTAVYTTHCAHAAVDLKNKAADDPITCSTQNYLLPGKTFKDFSGSLVVLLWNKTYGSTVCSYDYDTTGSLGCGTKHKTCTLKNKTQTNIYCNDSMTAYQESGKIGIFTFYPQDAVSSAGLSTGYNVQELKWVPDTMLTPPDFTIYADLPINHANSTIQINTKTPMVQINNAQWCTNLISKSSNPKLVYGDQLIYTMMQQDSDTSTPITCVGTYVPTSTGDGIQWQNDGNPICLSGFLLMQQAPYAHLKSLNYMMLDLSTIITRANNYKYGVTSVQLNDMSLFGDTVGDEYKGATDGTIYLYTNKQTTLLIAQPDPHSQSMNYLEVPTQSWVGLDNVLNKLSLPNNLEITYRHETSSTDCRYFKKNSEYTLMPQSDTNCPAKIHSTDNNIFTIPPDIQVNSSTQALAIINPTDQSSITFGEDLNNPVIMQFNPMNHRNGLMITNSDIGYVACNGSTGVDKWLQCSNWYGFDNVLSNESLPTNFVVVYDNDPETQQGVFCRYYKKYNYQPRDTDCPRLTIQDSLFVIPSSINISGVVNNLYQIRPTAEDDVAIMADTTSTSKDSVTMQFNPPNHPNGLKITNSAINVSYCNNADHVAIKGNPGIWLPCVTSSGDPWAGFGNILTDSALPDKFTAFYYSSPRDSEQCAYQWTHKDYKRMSLSCPQVQLQDDIVYVPTKMTNGALLGNIILENASAVVDIKNPNDNETTAGPAIMQFNPPNYPSGMKVTHQNIVVADCNDMKGSTISALNKWQTCSNK